MEQLSARASAQVLKSAAWAAALLVAMTAAAGGEAASREQTERARQALAAVLRSGPVSLAEQRTPDRYGRIQAQVFAADAWVQGALLRAGELRTAPDGVSAVCVTQLLGAEDAARLACRILARWRFPLARAGAASQSHRHLPDRRGHRAFAFTPE